MLFKKSYIIIAHHFMKVKHKTPEFLFIQSCMMPIKSMKVRMINRKSVIISLDEKAKDIMEKGCMGFIQKPFNIN